MNLFDVLTTVFICGLAGAIGGQTNKKLRRFLIPFALGGVLYAYTKNLFSILTMFMSFPISIGYGLPSINDPKPSFLGKFYYKLTKENHTLSNILTRGTIGLLISLSLIIIPILTHNWIAYIIGSLAIITVNASLSWRDFGEFTFAKTKLLKIEALAWGIIGGIVCLEILL